MTAVVDAAVSASKDRRKIENREARSRRDVRAGALDGFAFLSFLHAEIVARQMILAAQRHAFIDLTTSERHGAEDIAICEGKHQGWRAQGWLGPGMEPRDGAQGWRGPRDGAPATRAARAASGPTSP